MTGGVEDADRCASAPPRSLPLDRFPRNPGYKRDNVAMVPVNARAASYDAATMRDQDSEQQASDVREAVAGKSFVGTVIENVRDAFAPVVDAPERTPIPDPISQLEPEERKELEEQLQDIVRAQRDAEIITGG